MSRRLIVYSDGASRGNPGRASIGALVVEAEGSAAPVATVSEAIGIATNNEAEYRAVIAGLQAARDAGADEVIVRADSLLLVNQLNGVWRLKAQHLRPLYREALALVRGFSRVSIQHVPREANVEADALANEALDR